MGLNINPFEFKDLTSLFLKRNRGLSPISHFPQAKSWSVPYFPPYFLFLARHAHAISTKYMLRVKPLDAFYASYTLPSFGHIYSPISLFL
jgi:hypothetical protein